MWNEPYRKSDVESGSTPLYPMMLESPELRWSFIRKVYSIICMQLLLTIFIGCIVVYVRPISLFFVTTNTGLALYIVLIIMPFISMCFLFYYLTCRWSTLLVFDSKIISVFCWRACLTVQRCVLCTITTRNTHWITSSWQFLLLVLLSPLGWLVHLLRVRFWFMDLYML